MTGYTEGHFTEHPHTCNVCEGRGTIQGNREELYSELRVPEYSLREKIELIKLWLDEGEIPCPHCGGKGKWVDIW